MRNHRITKPDFRPCSTCSSRSQAPLCLCTLRMISNHSEGTFGRLRYTLGGDRPSQNCPPDTVSRVDKTRRLEFQYSQGGIPPAPPPKLALRFQRLPPILYKLYQNSISGYSKAPRGLSVLSRVTCIFTGTIIFTESLVETVPKSLHLSCGSELTRQGISLP
ncbi:putative cell wall-associated hydrolase [Bacillus anthracis]|nr:putative cell wall-associated hydrolase [Bacillus anthracis]